MIREPDVKVFLEREHFVKKLEEVFCSTAESNTCVECQHTFEYSVRILEEIGMELQEIEDTIAILNSKGCGCDCEILSNVVAEARLKDAYWKAKAAELSDG